MTTSVYCPHCHEFTAFTIKKWDSQDLERDTAAAGIICQCNNPKCRKLFYADGVCRYGTLIEIIKFFPQEAIPEVDSSIVESVKKDFDEANLCLSVNAINGAAMLARRALQTLCLDKGVKKGGELRTQIDELFMKNLINEDLKDSAHQIRLTGNDAAHSDPVSRNEVEETLELLGDLCEMVYVIPARNAARKVAREKKERETK